MSALGVDYWWRDFGPEDTDAAPALKLVAPPVMGRLSGWADQMQTDIGAADAKASTLLGWSGTALAVVSAVLVSSVSVGASMPVLARWVDLTGVLGLGFLAGSVISLVLVIRPRLGGRLFGGYTYNTDDRSFLTFASIPAQDVLTAACRDSEDLADPSVVVGRVQVLAAIALAKHKLIRLACTLLLASMPLLALAGAAMVAALGGGA